MGLDCALAQYQGLGNIAIRSALSDKGGDLSFAFGQPSKLSLGFFAGRRCPDLRKPTGDSLEKLLSKCSLGDLLNHLLNGFVGPFELNDGEVGLGS